MSVKDVSVLFVLQLPGEGAWPPDARVALLTANENGQSVDLFVYPYGHLEAVVRAEGSEARMHFQRVSVPITTMMQGTLVCGDGTIDLYFNGTQLARLGDSDGAVFEVVAIMPELHESVSDPEAVSQALQPSITRRGERFTLRPEFQSRRPNRAKSMQEQLAELENAVSALDHLVGQVKHGKMELLPNVAASLRGLVYWPPELGPTWNPLLLRLADVAGMGLLVYSPENDDPRPAVLDDAARHLQRVIVGLEPRHKPDRRHRVHPRRISAQERVHWGAVRALFGAHGSDEWDDCDARKRKCSRYDVFSRAKVPRRPNRARASVGVESSHGDSAELVVRATPYRRSAWTTDVVNDTTKVLSSSTGS